MNKIVSATDWQRRVAIEEVSPEINEGRFPIKRCSGERVVVRATIHADSWDRVRAVLQHRQVGEKRWIESPMKMINVGLDSWEGIFVVDSPGRYEYTIQAWMDTFETWRREIQKKAAAGQDISSELIEGARQIRAAAHRAAGPDADWLRRRVETLHQLSDQASRLQAAEDPELAVLMQRHADRRQATTYKLLRLTVERERAHWGAWYEMFPRSAGPDPSRSGTFREAEARLPEIAGMGFDVLYLPPIHPIGKTHRKGPNNSTPAAPKDPGSPWGIGSEAGGHKAIDPGLGSLEDFDHFQKAAQREGLELALDVAFQCSPDHPYVREHPEWFRHRPDGTIKYAENPPKKYEDIYPLDFECADWQALWQELRDVVIFWVKRGVSIFRVDNPHTKPYRFWEWLIQEVQDRYPHTIFLAEAFTRPKIMQYLAKLGFSQSYTYFTWRNQKKEITDYFTELTQTDVREYLRPNLFTNTPDILHDYLQTGGRPAFLIRLVLAATLGASFGIYGPPFELVETRAFPGTEDYVDSEKYQIRSWDSNQPGNIRHFITTLNHIRRQHPALHFNETLRFFPIDNEQLLAYGKFTPDETERLLMVVNLDPRHTQAGHVALPAGELGLGDSYEVKDLITGQTFVWHGARNYVQLDPQIPAHVLQLPHRPIDRIGAEGAAAVGRQGALHV